MLSLLSADGSQVGDGGLGDAGAAQSDCEVHVDGPLFAGTF